MTLQSHLGQYVCLLALNSFYASRLRCSRGSKKRRPRCDAPTYKSQNHPKPLENGPKTSKNGDLRGKPAPRSPEEAQHIVRAAAGQS